MIAQLRIIRTISKKQQQQQQSGASSLFRFGVQRRCWVKQISKIGVMPIFWLDFDKSVTACRKILQLEKKKKTEKREISNFKKKKSLSPVLAGLFLYNPHYKISLCYKCHKLEKRISSYSTNKVANWKRKKERKLK